MRDYTCRKCHKTMTESDFFRLGSKGEVLHFGSDLIDFVKAHTDPACHDELTATREVVLCNGCVAEDWRPLLQGDPAGLPLAQIEDEDAFLSLTPKAVA